MSMEILRDIDLVDTGACLPACLLVLILEVHLSKLDLLDIR